MKISVVSLSVDDLPKAVHFYRDVLGLSLVSHSGDLPHFQLENGLLVLVKGKPQPALDAFPERFPLLAIEVDDLDAMVLKMRKMGIELPYDIEEQHEARYMMFPDPAGNLIELVQIKNSSLPGR